MNPEIAEREIIELIYREPFAPFKVEMKDGHILEIPHARLAINGGGAGFIGADGGIVDFEFAYILAIRLRNVEAMA